MRGIKVLLAMIVFAVLMNTVGFAASTSSTVNYNVTIGAVTSDYNVSGTKVKKSNSYNYASMKNITGPSTSLGAAISTYVYCVEDDAYYSRKATLYESNTTATLYYDDLTTAQITANLKGKNFLAKAKITGYPRTDYVTFKAVMAP